MDEGYQREAVIHSEGEYVDEDVHVNTCESHCCTEASQKIISRRISERFNYAAEFCVKLVEELLNALVNRCVVSASTSKIDV